MALFRRIVKLNFINVVIEPSRNGFLVRDERSGLLTPLDFGWINRCQEIFLGFCARNKSFLDVLIVERTFKNKINLHFSEKKYTNNDSLSNKFLKKSS